MRNRSTHRPGQTAGLVWLLITLLGLSVAAQEATPQGDVPDSAEAHVARAREFALEQRDDEALEEYRRAAELDPTNALARTGIGEILRQRGALEEALGHLQAAIELDPDAERPRMAEAQVLHALERYQEAVERLEEAHEALPASGLAAYGLAWMLAASPDPELRDGERALDLAERVFESHQSLPNAELVAEALAELDRCQKAADWLRGIADKVAEQGAEAEIAARLERGIERFSQGPPCRAAAGPVGSASQ